MKTCKDCGVEIHEFANHTGNEKWCEDCFDRGLHQDMNDHFKNFIKGEIKIKNKTFETRANSGFDKYTEKLINEIYGPQFCPHCKMVQTISVYEKQGTQKSSLENNILTVSFEGDKVCVVCNKSILEK